MTVASGVWGGGKREGAVAEGLDRKQGKMAKWGSLKDSARFHQAGSDGEFYQFSGGMQIEFVHDPFPVPGDGLWA